MAYTTLTSYDDKGQLTGYTYPDGTSVERTYTDRGQLHLLKHAGTTIDTRTYDNGGRMTGSSYNNGGSETRAYNTDNTLSSIRYSSAAIRNMSYSWANIQTTPNKNETGETITGTMSGYGFSIPTSGYDDEDRLVTYNRTDGNLDQSWSLSSVGDWNSITSRVGANPPQTQSRAHGQSHELLSAAGQSVTHDTKGNITLIPNSLRPTPLALTWDFDNRMSAADVDNDSTADVTYQFDALGRRVARTAGSTTTVYVQSGQQTIADYPSGAASSAPTYRYVYGSYIDEPVLRYQPAGSQSVYYHRNQQYSVTAITSNTGAVLERYAYSAYGTPTFLNASGVTLPTSNFTIRHTYTGREWDDEIDLYHYRARMYDPELGRFCSKDPIGYVDGFNRYRFLGANPIDDVDPTGYFSEETEAERHERARATLRGRLRALCGDDCDKCSECTVDQCRADADRIAQGIFDTLENNRSWRAWATPYCRWAPRFRSDPDETYRGYYCYQWAWAFRQSVINVESDCFTTPDVQESFERGTGKVHYWIRFRSECSDQNIYVDDGFLNGDFVHEDPLVAYGRPGSPSTYPRFFPGVDPRNCEYMPVIPHPRRPLCYERGSPGFYNVPDYNCPYAGIDDWPFCQ